MDEREEALAQAAEENAAASKALGRTRLIAEATGEDITEDVVTVLEALEYSQAHSSGFTSEEDDVSIDKLKSLLRFPCLAASDPTWRFERGFLGRKRRILEATELCALAWDHDGPHSFALKQGLLEQFPAPSRRLPRRARRQTQSPRQQVVRLAPCVRFRVDHRHSLCKARYLGKRRLARRRNGLST